MMKLPSSKVIFETNQKMHNKAAIWIRIVEIKSKGQYMENLSITVDMVGKQANKKMNCTASVKDEVNSY